VHANATAKNPKLLLKLSLPKEGKPVLVDYEYLTIAFGYLFELFGARQVTSAIKIEAIENPHNWYLVITGIDEVDLNLIHGMYACKTDRVALSGYALLPEVIMGLHVACEIFHIQDIDLETFPQPQGAQILRLTVPAFTNKTKSMES
jgi:hypothetical protein